MNCNAPPYPNFNESDDPNELRFESVPGRVSVAFTTLELLHRMTLPTLVATSEGSDVRGARSLDAGEKGLKNAAMEAIRTYLTGENTYLPPVPMDPVRIAVPMPVFMPVNIKRTER